jgi:hypothetical protein
MLSPLSEKGGGTMAKTIDWKIIDSYKGIASKDFEALYWFLV